MSTWNILYRGSISSCNYSCGYCPFAKTTNTLAEIRPDERDLASFVSWVAKQKRRIGVLFTPWGEALVHRHYRRAISDLSRLPHVYRVSIQTNLSSPLGDLANADLRTVAFWTTFHPSETSLSAFLVRCQELIRSHIRFSVGAVGLREHLDAIEELRRALPPWVYLWINAFKETPEYYEPFEIQRLLKLDPYFHWNNHHYASAGKPCSAGETTFTVNGSGDVRRCHFIDEVIGNIYQADFSQCLKARMCSAHTCRCHIGYVHRPELRLHELYGDGLLERIPAQWPEICPDFAETALLSVAS